jgi:tripartite-type tricarboxylate transporter receptor subunit TctC
VTCEAIGQEGGMRRWTALVVLLTAWVPAFAQALPDQIRIIVPLAAGSSLDARARVIAEALGRRLNQRVIVENRPGAGSTVGTAVVARAKADGSTLLFNNSSHVFSSRLYANAGYDPVADFTPVARGYDAGMVLVAHPSLNVTSVKEVVALAKKSQNKLSYGSSGVGSLPHFAMALFERAAGISMVHVPYHADAQALTDLLGGQAPLLMSGYVAALPHVKAGKLRALAVTTPRRTPILSDVPTMAEAGYPDYSVIAWTGFWAPARTPSVMVERLNRELIAAIATPLVMENFAATGAEPNPQTPAAFAAFVKQEAERYARLVREMGLKAE